MHIFISNLKDEKIKRQKQESNMQGYSQRHFEATKLGEGREYFRK